MAAAGEFQKRALALFRAGHRVVPIPRGRKGPVVAGWAEMGVSQSEAQVEGLLQGANGCGVGILARWTAGVDIDVRDFELAQKLAGLAHELLGHTVERIGEAPKLLLPYRVETPFAKLSSHSFRLPGDQPGAKPHKVEILADGQQWVAYATHPDTGRPYHWPEGDLPAREDLPELTEAQARLFIERAEALIVGAGGRIEAKKLGGGGGRGKASAYGQAGTYEAVAAALRFIPNRELDYDDWIEIGLAIKGALGEAGLELWEGWSEHGAQEQPGDDAQVLGRVQAAVDRRRHHLPPCPAGRVEAGPEDRPQPRQGRRSRGTQGAEQGGRRAAAAPRRRARAAPAAR